MRGVERADVFEIPAGAEGAARAIEDRDRGLLSASNSRKAAVKRVGACRVHGIAGFGPVVNDRPHRSVFLDSDCHGENLHRTVIDISNIVRINHC